MCRVAYMLHAENNCCKCCDGSLFYFSEQENARKYKDASVLTSFLFVRYGLYMFCVACMIFASDAAVTFAIALLFTSKDKNMQALIRACVLTSFDFSRWILSVLCSFDDLCSGHCCHLCDSSFSFLGSRKCKHV